MMRRRVRAMRAAVMACLLGAVTQGQVVKLGKLRSLTSGSISVMLTNASVSFPIAGGRVAAGSNGVVINTSWSALSDASPIFIYGYFASSSVALTDGMDTISPSHVLGKVSTGNPLGFTAFTQTGPFGAAGGSLLLVNTGTLASPGGDGRTDTLQMEIDLTGSPQQGAGHYTGTLYIQAEQL